MTTAPHNYTMRITKAVGVCAFLSLTILVPALASSANDFKQQNVVHLGDNFLAATSDGKLYFTKVFF